jgi:hypothetical protein
LRKIAEAGKAILGNAVKGEERFWAVAKAMVV